MLFVNSGGGGCDLSVCSDKHLYLSTLSNLLLGKINLNTKFQCKKRTQFMGYCSLTTVLIRGPIIANSVVDRFVYFIFYIVSLFLFSLTLRGCVII